MQTDAAGRDACVHPVVHVAQGLQRPDLDVTSIAIAALMYGTVLVDAEAFGVTVSRREGADVSNLTYDERTRLLDVLCHAQCMQARGDDCSTFAVWIISSDARDLHPRAHYLTLNRISSDRFVIRLSDV